MEWNANNTTNTALTGGVSDYSVASKQTDGINAAGETPWYYTDWTKYLGYYKKIPELAAAITALANWTVGKGYVSDGGTRARLDRITGAGEDTFESIMWNMIVTKKINGDAFAEIIRAENGDIVNIKPLSPSDIITWFDDKGRIVRYEQISKVQGKAKKSFKPTQILHLMNDRIADEIHGTSVIEGCQWVIDARNEAMADWRRISHRSTIRVLVIDLEDTATLSTIKEQYKEAIKNGEVMIIPGKKGEVEFQELTLPPIEAFMRWIEYLENFFYTAVRVPKVVLGGSSEFTEASSKIALVTYDQAWNKEQADLQKDLWNQCGILIQWVKPASLISEAITSEDKNTGQLGFQDNDVNATTGKTNPTNEVTA